MMTADTTTPRRTVREPHGVARLTLTINGTSYAVRPFGTPDGTAWKLRRPDGTAHHVAPTPHGPTCTCGDFTWRRDGLDPRGCKHVRALVAVGLIES